MQMAMDLYQQCYLKTIIGKKPFKSYMLVCLVCFFFMLHQTQHTNEESVECNQFHYLNILFVYKEEFYLPIVDA